MDKQKKQELLRLHGVNDERNDNGVKDQSNSYRIRNGIFYRGFDVPTLEEAEREVKEKRAEGLKCFKEKGEDGLYYRIFFEEKLKKEFKK